MLVRAAKFSYAMGVSTRENLIQRHLPKSLVGLLTDGPREGSIQDVNHVILYMQENRSFDHYFGHLPGVIGYDDPTVLPRRGGGTVLNQPRRGSGSLSPSESDMTPYPVSEMIARYGEKTRNELAHLPHTYVDGMQTWADGWWDGWIPAKGLATMGYYTASEIPVQHAAAEAFTLCDQYFASMMAGTTPNRHYWMTGRSGFEPLSDRSVSGLRCVENDAFDSEPDHTGYTWDTQAEALERAGVTWQVYQEWDNYGDNNLEYFVTFKRIAKEVLKDVEGGRFAILRDFYLSFLERSPESIAEALSALEKGVEALGPADRQLYERGLRRCAPGELTEWMARDMESGHYPTVSYVVAPSHLCEHPETSNPSSSGDLTYRLLDVLGNHPDVFNKSVTIYTFDEFDGLYDHVPPPVPPPGAEDEWVDNPNGGEPTPMGLGARVPAIVISPWSVGGRVCSEVFEHTSNVQLIERVTGVDMPTISPWRRAIAGDFTSALGFDGVEAATATRPKPRCTLPYDLDVQCDTSHFPDISLTITNSGKNAAPVAVYGFAGETKKPLHDVVPAGGQCVIKVVAHSQEYNLVVTGPAAFRRDFSSTVNLSDESLPMAQSKG